VIAYWKEVISLFLHLLNSLWDDLFWGEDGTRVWTQGLAFAKQALYHLSHTFNWFCFSLLFRYSLMSLPRVGFRPWSSYFHLAEITGMYHHSQLVLWNRVFLTFAWAGLLPWFPISTSYGLGYKHAPSCLAWTVWEKDNVKSKE
jgi:hypothetical protein